MIGSTRVAIPTLVRVKPGALERMGIYLSRFGHRRVVVQSAGLVAELPQLLAKGMDTAEVQTVLLATVADNAFEEAIRQFTNLPRSASAIVCLGG